MEQWIREPCGSQTPFTVGSYRSASIEDEGLVNTAIMQDARGQPPKKRVKRSTKQLQERLLQLCQDRRDGRKSIEDTLRGLGHNIRF